jgi:hypothetical protein
VEGGGHYIGGDNLYSEGRTALEALWRLIEQMEGDDEKAVETD